jgi:hypothetical protein
MATFNDQDYIGKFTRTSQIIVGALIAGVLIFLAIAWFVDVGLIAPAPAGPGAVQGAAPGNAPGAGAAGDGALVGTLITYMAVGWAVVAIPLSFGVPALIAKQQRKQIASGSWAPGVQQAGPGAQLRPESWNTDSGKLAAVYQQQLIIAAALVEGAAFFTGIAYMLGRNPIALGVTLLLVAILLLRFPTIQRVERWIERQQEKLMEDRQAAT